MTDSQSKIVSRFGLLMSADSYNNRIIIELCSLAHHNSVNNVWQFFLIPNKDEGFLWCPIQDTSAVNLFLNLRPVCNVFNFTRAARFYCKIRRITPTSNYKLLKRCINAYFFSDEIVLQLCVSYFKIIVTAGQSV